MLKYIKQKPEGLRRNHRRKFLNNLKMGKGRLMWHKTHNSLILINLMTWKFKFSSQQKEKHDKKTNNKPGQNYLQPTSQEKCQLP